MISSDLSKQISSAVSNNFDSQVGFLSKLVRARSVNPFSSEETTLKEPVELAVSELIRKKLKSVGVTPKSMGASKNRPNVVSHLGPRRYRKSLILNGHMDTGVPASGNKRSSFSGLVKRGRLYGAGALNMKGALSAYIYAVKVLVDLGVKLDGRLTLAFVVDAESGACSEWGTQLLINKGIRARAALIGKPGTHTVAIGHRGGYRFRLKVSGEAVHTGLSLWEKKKMGRNAIVDMAEAIRVLRKFEVPFKSARLFPGRKPTFTFPTMISGGHSVNVVPDECVGYGDVRLMPGNSDRQIRLLIQDKLSRISGISYQIEDLLFVPAVEIDPKEDLVEALVGEAESVLGEKPAVRGVGPWNDAWMYITSDIPTVCGFGPDGEVTQNEEWVSLASLKKVTEVYVRVIIQVLGLKDE